jgi:chromosome segregation ATPase
MRYLNRGGEIHTRQFRCANALIGLCDKTKLHYSVVEDAVLKFCEGLDVADVMPNREKAESEKSRLLNQLQAKEGEIEIIDNTMEGNLASKRIGKSEAYLIALEKSWARLNDSKIKLEAEKKDIQTQLAELSNNSKQTAEQLNSIKELIDLMKTLRKDESKKQELINIRLSLRTQLRRLIEQIIVHAENKTLTIYFRTGQRRVLNLTTSEIIVDAYPEKIFGKK